MGIPDYTLLDTPEISSRMFQLDSDGIPSSFGRWEPLPEGASSHVVNAAGVALACRLFPSKESSSSILFFHGNGEVVSDYNNIYPHIYPRGISLFAAEYRGYGASYGTPTYSTMISDAHHVYRYFIESLKQESGGDKIFVMGRSLGAAAALELAAYYQDDLDGVIIESGSAGMNGWDRWFRGSDELAKLRNLQGNHRDKLKSISIPLLTIHGDKDAVVPLERAFELHDMVASEVKVLDIIPNVGHNTIFLYGMETYMQSLESFINKV